MTPDDLAGIPPAKLPFPITRTSDDTPEFRAEGDERLLLRGTFTTFDDPYEVHSAIEGHFIERMAPGAFDRTVVESRKNIKPLFNHGQDPTMGNQILGPIEDLRGDGRYAIDPLPGIPPLIRQGLEAGLYGSSHRFSVISDVWDYQPATSASNPNGIPERTITEAKLYEFGPVTFPANPNATAGIRSTTDDYYQRSTDATAFETLLRSAQVARTPAPAEVVATPTEGSPQSDAGSPRSPETDAQRTVHPVTAKETVTVTDSLKLHPVEQEARITELEESIARQAEETGIPSVENQARWDADTAELTELRAARAVRAQRQAFVATIAPKAENTTSGYSAPNVVRSSDPYDLGQYAPGQVRSYEERDQKLRDNAMRSLDASSFAHSNVDQSRAKEGVQALLDIHDSRDREVAARILITGSPQYKRDFARSLQEMRPVGLVAEASGRAAALAVTGTTTTGGYMLPYTFDPTFIKTGAWTRINPYRQVCRVEQITGSNNWQGVSVGAVPAIYETEALAVTEAGPTFARPTLTAQRASSFVSLSYETLQDRPDVVSEIADLIQEGKDTLEEAQFSVGVGTTVYPLGMFVKNTFTVKETITDNTFAVADLDATEAALPIRHRADAVWMLSRAVIRIIQGWETAYGKYFASTLGYPAVGELGQNPGGNTGLNLLGYPVWETPSAPVTVTGDDTIVGILVSPKNYMILDRVGMNVELIPNLVDAAGLPTGQRGILALWRNTAKALNADAGRQININ
jgi:HK97 family phage major capsid protein